MKNFLLIAFSSFSMVGFSQRIMRIISDTPQSTIVDVYRLRNGTSGIVVGPKGFDATLSDGGSFSFYTPRSGNIYNSIANDMVCDLTLPNHSICDGVFENKSITTFNYHSFYFNNQQQFQISPKVMEIHADDIYDGNSNIDLLRLQFHLPKKMDDGSMVPAETWAILWIGNVVDLDLIDGNSGVSDYIFLGKDIMMKFDGDRWVEQDRDWSNNPKEIYESECGEKIVEETVAETSQLIIYPNPSSDFVYLKSSSAQSIPYDFNFFDMLGRKVLSGQVALGQGINIQKFSAGNYIIQLSIKDIIVETKKIIKK